MYNEERILRKSVLEVCGSASKALGKFEILIVDDSSHDHSGEIGRALARTDPRVRYLRFDNGPSRRENLAKAFSEAKGEIILFSDTDLAADISALKNLVGAIEGRYDVAIGCRYMKGSNTKRKLTRRLISFLYNNFIRLYFGSRIKDHNCGFKAFRRDVLLELVKEAGYDSRFRRGWFWDAEIIVRAQTMGFRIKEIPVNWKEGKKSTFSLKRELIMVPYVIKLKKRVGVEGRREGAKRGVPTGKND